MEPTIVIEWNQDSEFKLTPIELNGATVTGSYRLLNGLWHWAVQVQGATPELSFNASGAVADELTADTLATAAVEGALAVLENLPAPAV